MNEIKDDLKAIRIDLSGIKVDVAKNTVSLENHMYRTTLAEKRISYLERIFMGLAAVAVLGGIIKLIIA